MWGKDNHKVNRSTPVINGEFYARGIPPQHGGPKDGTHLWKYIVLIILGLLSFSVLANAASIHHTSSAHRPQAATPVIPKMPSKARIAQLYHQDEAYFAKHPYPIYLWWVFAASKYTCVPSDTLPYGDRNPIQARITMRKSGQWGHIRMLGKEGGPNGVMALVMSSKNAGIYYFSSYHACKNLQDSIRTTDNLNPLFAK